FDPPNFELVPVGSYAKGIQDWTRASSLTVYQGKLFSSTATCYRAQIDPPPSKDDIRGKVFCMQTGAGVSSDRDMGAGWKQIAAVRKGRTLSLFVDGKRMASATSDGPKIEAAADAPLRIGFGPQSCFHGKICNVRLYNQAISEDEIQHIVHTDQQVSDLTAQPA